MLRSVRVALAPLLLPIVACAQEKAPGAGGLPPTANQAARWYEIARTSQIVAYLDTARVERPSPGVARIWFRFAYGTPMTVGADTSVKYAAMEAREEVDCANRRTKDLEMRMEATTGVSTGTPLPTPEWKPMDTHPLNSGVFLVACRALGTPIPAKPGV